MNTKSDVRPHPILCFFLRPNKKMKALSHLNLLNLILCNVILICLFWFVLHFLPLPALDCIHPLARPLIFALCIALILNVLAIILAKLSIKQLGISISIFLASIVLAWWLGSYPYSPLMGFANGHKSILSGFRITRQGRAIVTISSGDTLSLARGSYTSIEALVTPGSASCAWQSLNDGALDGADTCDLIYSPPKGTDYDILKVLVAPGCGLPKTTGQIKISILP